jgi:hypothetical protein
MRIASPHRRPQFFEADHVARLLQPLRDILRGPVVAGGAGSAVAAIRDRDVLQCLQVTEGALAGPRVEPDHRRRRGDVLRAINCLLRDLTHDLLDTGHTALTVRRYDALARHLAYWLELAEVAVADIDETVMPSSRRLR